MSPQLYRKKNKLLLLMLAVCQCVLGRGVEHEIPKEKSGVVIKKNVI